jgi:hypothetical protein
MKLSIKPGDVFETVVENKKRYLQYLINDDNCLNANVIRVFKYVGELNDHVDLQRIVQSSVDFFCHSYMKGGVSMNVWKKIGNAPLPKDFELPTFRQTNEVASVVSKSYQWFIWKVGEQRRRIGELTDEYRALPVAGVTHPLDINKRIQTGINGFKYPE